MTFTIHISEYSDGVFTGTRSQTFNDEQEYEDSIKDWIKHGARINFTAVENTHTHISFDVPSEEGCQ